MREKNHKGEIDGKGLQEEKMIKRGAEKNITDNVTWIYEYKFAKYGAASKLQKKTQLQSGLKYTETLSGTEAYLLVEYEIKSD